MQWQSPASPPQPYGRTAGSCPLSLSMHLQTKEKRIMSTSIAATEYRNLPLSILTESKTNPRRIFENAALKELAIMWPMRREAAWLRAVRVLGGT